MTKNFFFCAFLLFGQIFLLKAQLKTVFKTGKTGGAIVSKVHLFLAGNFNGWNPSDTLWQLRPDSSGECQLAKMMSPGIYQFKVTRGSWQTV